MGSIKKLVPFIKSPTLVVGAGQGLLVEELQKQGLEATGVDYEPLMVEYAEKRRGLKLIQAYGADMPFDDNNFKVSIIATGVLDFMDDDKKIKPIINETQRVTDESGAIFVAFHRFHPKQEQLMRFGGMLTDKNIWRYRRTREMLTLKFFAFLKAVEKEANVGTLSAFLTLVKIQMGLPRKAKRHSKSWAKAWKHAQQDVGSVEPLLACIPEALPYRNEQRIESMFKNFDIPIQKMFDFESCTVVQL